MSRIRNLLPHLNPLLIQLAAVASGGIVVVAVALLSSSVVNDKSGAAANQSSAALLTATIKDELDAVNALRIDEPVREQGQSGVEVRIPLDQAIAAHDALAAGAANAEELHLLIGSDVTLQIWGAVGEANSALDIYLLDPTQTNYEDLQTRLTALQTLTAFEVPRLTSLAESNQSTLRSASGFARTVIIIAAVVSALGVATTTFLIGRRLRYALEHAEQEQSRLVEASQSMQRRNDQFAALYQLGTEVSESLSMEHVTRTTIREAKRLMGADAITLRRLEEGELRVAGVEQEAPRDLEEATSLPLGAGLTGRAAKRGRTVRVDQRANESIAEGEGIAGVESALVVPLIVGARVVGTLSCWSRVAHHFTADDEQILEMMASQVATAIAAAGVLQASSQAAHHDPLTDLMNRRQLNSDLVGWLRTEHLQRREPLAVAMVDIDNFKRFNDDYGHQSGDAALRLVARALSASARDQDRVYRYGGEEFLVVFPGTKREGAAEAGERLRKAIQDMPVTGEDHKPLRAVTVSVGVAAFPDHTDDLGALIDLADRAMYASKEMGRNRTTVYGDEQVHLAA